MVHGVFVALVVTAAWILAHVGWMQFRPAENRIRSMTRGYLLSLPLVWAAYRWLPAPAAWAEAAAGEAAALGWFHAYFLHLLLFLLYVECFYHIERAVTTRILIEIMRHPGGAPTLDSIRRQYDVREMIRRRLDVLTEHQYIQKDGDRWKLLPRGRLFAAAMRISAWIFQSHSQRERV